MQADRDSEYLVLEAGAGKPGDIAILSEVVRVERDERGGVGR